MIRLLIRYWISSKILLQFSKVRKLKKNGHILNIVFANFFMDGKNVEISMSKNFKFLSKIGGCKDWCTRVDELLNSIVDETSDINGWKNEGWAINFTDGEIFIDVLSFNSVYLPIGKFFILKVFFVMKIYR